MGNFRTGDRGSARRVPDGSVDVVTTRSVMIYVTDKATAFEAFDRVLGPGGRLSLFEPINRLTYPELDERFWGYELRAVKDLAAKVIQKFTALEDETFRPAIMGFDDRDLAHLAYGTGFERVHVACHIDIGPGSRMRPVNLQALLDSAPNPHAPTLREAIAVALTDSERRRFVDELQRAFAEDKPVSLWAGAYLTATKTL